MSAHYKPRRHNARSAGWDGTMWALKWAGHVFSAVDRRSPEAGALSEWLAQHAMSFGVPDTALPGDGAPTRVSPRTGLSELDWRVVHAAIKNAAAKNSPTSDTPACLWVSAISDVMGLDRIAADILTLALHYALDQRVERLFDAMCDCRGLATSFQRDADLIALLLDAPVANVAAQIGTGARLLDTGLLRLGRNGELIVLDRLVGLIRKGEAPVADFYGQLLGNTEPQTLPWDAFEHLGREADIAAAVLQTAIASGESGVNILLYGPPGTGKTSFAATLADRIGARLQTVAETDHDDGEPSRFARLAGLRLAQRLCVGRGTVLLFDEAEDLFVDRSMAGDEPVTSSRVFMHRLLERIAVPMLWTANDISVLGPAVLRRMTMCLELRVPDLATRTRLWRRMGEAEGVVLEDDDAARLARLVPAAPAVASASLRATRLAGGGAEITRIIVEGVARAVGGRVLPAPEREPDALYDPRLVNADCDLERLAADLLRPGAMRAVSFLLSGPPGVGKSAWIRHLAARMGMPVLQKRASDLLNMWLGGTEQNIAGAFAEAREANAFLVFDEADSLLLERAHAVRSWEISQVNEMLTWMESHALPFACTTNLAERLDRASLRRFLVKLRFDWLTIAQARLAFRQFFDLEAPAALDGSRLLTPADFALVRRRAAVRGGGMDPAEIVRALAAESEGRLGGGMPVGFSRSEVSR